LEHCLANTQRAEDRSIYENYLADAAGILALAVVGAPIASLSSRVEAHGRLWGHTWLQDDVYREAASAWNAAKKEIAQIAT
jgi:hypothetical protein